MSIDPVYQMLIEAKERANDHMVDQRKFQARRH
jgi:hypothetical protein